MRKWIYKHASLALISLFISCAHAETPNIPYQQLKLPDGSMEVNYSQSDGSKVKQIYRIDGTIETMIADKDGSKNLITTNPNGSVETQIIQKKS